jgi:hypothetical protein
MPSAEPSPSSPAPSRKSDRGAAPAGSGADGPAASGASRPRANLGETPDVTGGTPAPLNQGEKPDPHLPVAWQPLTFRGVAAFADAKLGRLLLVQFIVALITAGTVGWFLSIHWFPSVRKAIRQLPDTGIIRAGQLVTPRGSTAPLVETRYLSIAVDAADTGVASSLADVRIEFHRTSFAVCGFAGCMRRAYAADATMQFNRSELESWWGAWQPMLFGITALVVVAGLFASWLVLATLYFPIAWVIAYFKDRRLTARGAWKLAAAALLPGALLVCGGIILYGLGIADLLRLLVLWLAHFAVGWVYLIMSPFRLPPVTAKPKANPFGRAKPASPNPFTSSNG